MFKSTSYKLKSASYEFKSMSYKLVWKYILEQKDLEARTAFSWILLLTWNFVGDRSDTASSWFWCCLNYNWLFYMLHNDDIKTSVSEAVEKIPADEKDYRKRSFVVFCFAQSQHKKSRPTYITANRKNSFLPTRIHSVQLKRPL